MILGGNGTTVLLSKYSIGPIMNLLHALRIKIVNKFIFQHILAASRGKSTGESAKLGRPLLCYDIKSMEGTKLLHIAERKNSSHA
jgi:hypothetical protein